MALADVPPGGLECSIRIPECNGTGQRSRPRPNGMTVIAALHNPLTVLLADDLADVVTPDDNRANSRTTSV
jgi:hypothetical protein